jgi:hypothetical protein
MAIIRAAATTKKAVYWNSGYVEDDGDDYSEQGYVQDLRQVTSVVFIGSTFISGSPWDDIIGPIDQWSDVSVGPPAGGWGVVTTPSGQWAAKSSSPPSGGWSIVTTTENPFG